MKLVSWDFYLFSPLNNYLSHLCRLIRWKWTKCKFGLKPRVKQSPICLKSAKKNLNINRSQFEPTHRRSHALACSSRISGKIALASTFASRPVSGAFHIAHVWPNIAFRVRDLVHIEEPMSSHPIIFRHVSSFTSFPLASRHVACASKAHRRRNCDGVGECKRRGKKKDRKWRENGANFWGF